MKLSKSARRQLGQELQFIVRKMGESADPFHILYFFSGAYGEIGRLLNRQWDPELALLHLVLQSTYGQIHARFQAYSSGGDRGIGTPAGLLDALSRTMAELADIVLEDKSNDMMAVMSRFSELGYLCTGNGYYLYSKGAIQFDVS